MFHFSFGATRRFVKNTDRHCRPIRFEEDTRLGAALGDLGAWPARTIGPGSRWRIKKAPARWRGLFGLRPVPGRPGRSALLPLLATQGQTRQAETQEGQASGLRSGDPDGGPEITVVGS